MRVRAFFIIPSLVVLLAALSGCATGSKQIPEHFTCIPTKLFRCEPDEQTCMTIPIISSLGAVQISVNLADRKVRSFSEERILSKSDIDSVEEENGLIYFNGKGQGVDNTYRAWNAIIDRNNGSLYSSSITAGAGHVTYGECYEDKQ